MGAEFAVETLKPAELGADARALWAAFRAADPALRSPYFDFRYVLAAGEAAPGSEVAVISRGGEIQGFLPFQRRGSLIQPVAAPLTDYHGAVAAHGAQIDLKAVVAALGARRFRFTALVGAAPATEGHEAMIADLSDGLDAYLERRPGGFLKDKRRRARRLAEDHGPLDFRLSAEDDGALDFIVRLKRDQFRRTGQHDLFASRWPLTFIRHLADLGEDDFGLRFAVLRAGDRIVAAELGLRSGDAYHLWFPVYDRELARYSPGALMTLETIRAAAGQGIASVDFGPWGESYKTDFAEPGISVVEGETAVDGLSRTARDAARRALALTPRLREAGLRLNRRWDRIAACEPALEGRLGAASKTLSDLARRRPKTSLGLGLGLSVGLATLLID